MQRYNKSPSIPDHQNVDHGHNDTRWSKKRPNSSFGITLEYPTHPTVLRLRLGLGLGLELRLGITVKD